MCLHDLILQRPRSVCWVFHPTRHMRGHATSPLRTTQQLLYGLIIKTNRFWLEMPHSLWVIQPAVGVRESVHCRPWCVHWIGVLIRRSNSFTTSLILHRHSATISLRFDCITESPRSPGGCARNGSSSIAWLRSCSTVCNVFNAFNFIRFVWMLVQARTFRFLQAETSASHASVC